MTSFSFKQCLKEDGVYTEIIARGSTCLAGGTWSGKRLPLFKQAGEEDYDKRDLQSIESPCETI